MKKYNIYCRKDGRWEGRLSRGKSCNGKRKYQYIYDRNRAAVEKRMAEIYNSRFSESSCNKDISAVFGEWFFSVKHRIKESTASNYIMKVNKHIIPYFKGRAIDALTRNDLYEFIGYKQKQGLSDRYITDIIILMKSIFKFAVREYHIFNPMDGVTLPKRNKSDIRLLDKNEQATLQKYVSDRKNHTTLGIALAMSTGIRIGELCALKWEDIDLKKRILTVRNTIQRIQCNNSKSKTKLIITEPKSESSKRSIPIPKCIMDFLKQFKSSKGNYILSGTETPVEPRTMQYRFSRILKNVKLPSIHFHALRHMFASNCIKLGFDVKSLSEILGHSSVEITLNRYVHSSFEQKQKYMKRIEMCF
ncbi:MAG: tyrosine recombinase XerC [Porcipelethomonas sp.]